MDSGVCEQNFIYLFIYFQLLKDERMMGHLGNKWKNKHACINAISGPVIIFVLQESC